MTLTSFGEIVNGKSNTHESQPLNTHLAPLKISVINNAPPFNIELPNGRITGMYVEFWRLWSKYSHRPVEFISSDFISNINDLKNADVDFHSGLFKSKERESWAKFSIPIHQVQTSLYFYNKHFQMTELKNMHGKKVAVAKGSLQATYFANKYPNIKFILFTDNYKVIDQLLNGEFDALIGEEPFIDSLLTNINVSGLLSKSSEKLMSNLVYALVPNEKQHLLNEINQGIRQIPINEIIKLERKWISGSKPYFSEFVYSDLPNLTLNEIDWIKSKPLISVASSFDRPPIEFLQNGTYQGVAIDYLKIIEQKMNIKLKHKEGFSTGESLDNRSFNNIELLSEVAGGLNTNDSFILSDPFAQFKIVAMVRPNSTLIENLSSLKNKVIGAVLDKQMKKILIENHPHLTVINMENTYQGLSDLNSNKIDVFIGNHFLIAHHLEKFKSSNIKVGLFTEHNIDLKMAVSKKQKEFLSIINKVFSNIPNRKKVAILNNWKGNDTIEVNDQFERFLQFAIPTLVGVMSLLLYVSYLNRKMVYEITKRKQKEERLILEKEKADSANRAKDDFLANMSHELRSPMNAIIGSSYLLNLSDISSSQEELVETMDHSAQNLLRLINNILDLSKLEAGKLNLENNSFNVRELCKSIFEKQLHDISDSSIIKKHFHVDPRVPNLISSDSYRLQQILENIILNARIFTHQGSISLLVKNTLESDLTSIMGSHKKSYLRFEIVDTGIGIDEEHIKRLFTNFNQTDTSSTRIHSGAGLGLRLTQSLCAHMGTKLEVESKLKYGSRFYFDLPYTNSIDNAEVFNLAGKKVLIVDDNPINLMVAKKTLENHKLDVKTTDGADKALELLKNSQFDVILMDIQMPNMSGIEATIHIRNGSVQPNIPIFALSASISDEEQEGAIEAGMNGCLRKPIVIEQLMEKVSNALF